MFQDLAQEGDDGGDDGGGSTGAAPQPGRVSHIAGVLVQDESEFGPMCRDRAANSFNSGMGE